MRKFVISSVIILTVFICAMTIFGQPSEGSGQGQREQLENMREQWRNMSEEERQKRRADMRGRADSRGLSLKVQLQVIKTIEEQVAKLKSAVESMSEGREQYQNMSEEQRAQYREKIGKISLTRQQAIAAIEQQLERLRFRGQRQQVQEPEIRINELREIHQLAVKEKATETAKKLESFISSYQQRQSRTQSIRPRPREGQAERTPRQRQPRLQEEQ